jgi:hypothetical protein
MLGRWIDFNMHEVWWNYLLVLLSARSRSIVCVGSVHQNRTESDYWFASALLDWISIIPRVCYSSESAERASVCAHSAHIIHQNGPFSFYASYSAGLQSTPLLHSWTTVRSLVIRLDISPLACLSTGYQIVCLTFEWVSVTFYYHSTEYHFICFSLNWVSCSLHNIRVGINSKNGVFWDVTPCGSCKNGCC